MEPEFQENSRIIKVQCSPRSHKHTREDYHSEKELYELERLFDIHHPKWVCPEGNEIAFLCTDPSCKALIAMACRLNSCATCSSLHDDRECGRRVTTKYITRLVEEQAQTRKRFLLDIYEQEENMIRKLRENRKREVQKYRFGHLSQELNLMLTNMYVDNQNVELTSKQTLTMLSALENFQECQGQFKQSLLDSFHEKTMEVCQQLKDHKAKILTSFSKNHQKKKKFKMQKRFMEEEEVEQQQEQEEENKENKENKENRVNLLNQDSDFGAGAGAGIKTISSSMKKYQLREKKEKKQKAGSKALKEESDRTIINSTILNFDKGDLDFINQSLNNPKQIKLLFKASEHGFKSQMFHKYSDNVPHTLTLITTEFGKRIGGYSHFSWNCSADSAYVQDAEGRSFIFSLDMKEVLTLKDRKKAICCRQSDGPTFGQGYDIGLSNKCHKNRNSYARVGWSYWRSQPQKRKKDDALLFKVFTGAPVDCSFKVNEYEVYQVEL